MTNAFITSFTYKFMHLITATATNLRSDIFFMVGAGVQSPDSLSLRKATHNLDSLLPSGFMLSTKCEIYKPWPRARCILSPSKHPLLTNAYTYSLRDCRGKCLCKSLFSLRTARYMFISNLGLMDLLILLLLDADVCLIAPLYRFSATSRFIFY